MRGRETIRWPMYRSNRLAFLLLSTLLVGCATAGGGSGDPTPDADIPGLIDASPRVDATIVPGVDAGPMIDAPVPPDIDASPMCQDVTVQLLSNPGLELGTSGWVETPPGEIVGTEAAGLPVTPQAGTFAAWFGGLDDATHTLYQDVAIPADTSSMQIQLYYRISTNEFLSGEYDHFTFSLRNTSNTVLETIAEYSNQDDVGSWQLINYNVAGNYSGQTVRFHMTSTTDGSFTTSFYTDSARLDAVVCQ